MIAGGQIIRRGCIHVVYGTRDKGQDWEFDSDLFIQAGAWYHWASSIFGKLIIAIIKTIWRWPSPRGTKEAR